jgi:hypothetical protein
MIRDIYNLAKGIPETQPTLKQEARNVITQYFITSKIDETEYAGMLRAFFRNNPINF